VSTWYKATASAAETRKISRNTFLFFIIFITAIIIWDAGLNVNPVHFVQSAPLSFSYVFVAKWLKIGYDIGVSLCPRPEGGNLCSEPKPLMNIARP
jgi:hypothetical protein